MTEVSLGEAARSRFEGLAAELSATGDVASWDVRGDGGGLVLTLRRDDGATAVVELAADTRTCLVRLADTYEDREIADGEPDRLEALEDKVAIARLYLRRRYHEEVSRRWGRVVARTIHLAGKEETFSLSASPGGVPGLVGRLLGGRTSIVRP
ncbi:hypothetical protein Val02_21860 [Virgisporangium aliadipatigenens]|uniref:Uncharacterized protein n=1 Tax=Virgisporangium aliadipatigenens TaxID=741659 RepID=A0A8J3YJV7_9ACTN|nr:hypothetical protein [Virgisporangium aliadipatigenens]GIJ45300.1 hypothetical protein Val02_21860 [Virgisporangium aliadipatigenens]